jgi:hypothetical protein
MFQLQPLYPPKVISGYYPAQVLLSIFLLVRPVLTRTEEPGLFLERMLVKEGGCSSSLIGFGGTAFTSCISLESFIVTNQSKTNAFVDTAGGVLFNLDLQNEASLFSILKMVSLYNFQAFTLF